MTGILEVSNKWCQVPLLILSGLVGPSTEVLMRVPLRGGKKGAASVEVGGSVPRVETLSRKTECAVWGQSLVPVGFHPCCS